MPRYFFHIRDGGTSSDDEIGTEFETVAEVRKAAMALLPDVAREELPRNGDYRSFVVLVVDEHRSPVYTATLSYTGLWLHSA